MPQCVQWFSVGRGIKKPLNVRSKTAQKMFDGVLVLLILLLQNFRTCVHLLIVSRKYAEI